MVRESDKIETLIVAWRNVCKHTSQRGLGLKYLITLNNASNLKFYWAMLNSQEDWALLLKFIALKNGVPSKYDIDFSI